MSPDKPNIIMIVSDQHRGDWMGCSGSRIVNTPHMDRMAAGGVRFTRAYCNSPLCVPSRMSMLTGRLPVHTGVHHNNDMLGSDIPTMAHALGLGGYETVLCGRMHFVGPDQRHGYQRRLVGDITDSYLGGPKTPYGDLEGTAGQGLTSVRKAGPGTSPVHQYDEQVLTAWEKFLTERKHDQENPLFLTIGFYGPHHPYVCPPELYKESLTAMRQYDTLVPKDDHPRHPWLDHWFERLRADDIDPAQLHVARACYAGNISLLDRYIGRILNAVESLPGDTWVIYTSDHGDMAGDRGMFWKRSFYEGAIRIPLIFYPLQLNHSSYKVAKGSTIHEPVSLLDLAPTLVAMTSSPDMPQGDGDDISPLLNGETFTVSDLERWRNRPILVELANQEDSAIRAVVYGDKKLVVYYGYEPVQLFNLSEDPFEKRNLAEDTEYQDMRNTMLEIATKGWNASDILSHLYEKRMDVQYLTKWGREVGMGPLDLWNYSQRVDHI